MGCSWYFMLSYDVQATKQQRDKTKWVWSCRRVATQKIGVCVRTCFKFTFSSTWFLYTCSKTIFTRRIIYRLSGLISIIFSPTLSDLVLWQKTDNDSKIDIKDFHSWKHRTYVSFTFSFSFFLPSIDFLTVEFKFESILNISDISFNCFILESTT